MSEEAMPVTSIEMPPWQQETTFNTYYTYSFIGRSSFYAMINPAYYDYMNRFVRQELQWYDGWVPWFHTQSNGIFSTRIAQALVDKAAKKVVGGRIRFKNAGAIKDGVGSNASLSYIAKWSDDTNFPATVKKAVQFAAAGGTALVSLNLNSKGILWTQAFRQDQFIPTVGEQGEIIAVDIFLKNFVNLGNKDEKTKAQAVDNYYVVEHRYFGDYMRANGEILRNVPLVIYVIKRDNGNVTTGSYVSNNNAETIRLEDVTPKIRSNISKSYATLTFDKPILLPFIDSLGCELVKWTDGVSNVPELPFGESFLSNIIGYLISWDYYFSCFNTDMYTGRARVLLSAIMQKANADGGGNYNAGLDSFLYTKIPNSSPDEQKPVPIQFDLRSTSWTEIRTMLIQNIAVNTGLNISTIASFLQDNTARTAREISTEENETSGFVDDKREIIERPLNRILKLVRLYYQQPDEVVIRWSRAGLTNIHTLAEVISIGKQNGFISRKKAIEMFNFDDDTEQVQEEVKQCGLEEDEKQKQAMNNFDGSGF